VNGDDKEKIVADIQAFQLTAAKYFEEQRQRQAAEETRRARLTPQQRAEEDRANAAMAARAQRAKLLKKFQKLGDSIRQPDTWTIERFSWLLLAESPEDPDSWTFFDGRDGKATKQHKHFRDILKSCVPTRLKPVNPNEAPDKFRFTVQSLMEAAQAKRLGCFEVLAEILGVKPTEMKPAPPVPVARQLAVSGTQSRERQRIRRRLALLETARAIAKAGEGTVHSTHIALSMNGKELNRRFQDKFPEWAKISPKTLEADRTACKPRIEVTTGRPRKVPV
jgi:hypothetical protein